MRLLVDGRILGAAHPTGVERALRTLLVGLVRIGGDHEVRLAGARFAGCRTVPALGRLRTPGPEVADLLLSPVTAVPPFGAMPRIATVHDLPWVSRASVRSTQREWRQRIRLALTRRAAGRIQVPSRATGRSLERVPGENPPIDVIPLGLHPDVLGPVDDEARARAESLIGNLSGSILLNVGAPRRRKAPARLLMALATIRRERSATLVLAGPDSERFADREGVLALGFVEDAVLRALYDRADVLVHASPFEGCGLTPLEAMARGTPVVAAAAEAVVETVGDAAELVPVGDPVALGESVLRVLEDTALREDLVARGRAVAAARTPEAHAEAVLASCREALR